MLSSSPDNMFTFLLPHNGQANSGSSLTEIFPQERHFTVTGRIITDSKAPSAGVFFEAAENTNAISSGLTFRTPPTRIITRRIFFQPVRRHSLCNASLSELVSVNSYIARINSLCKGTGLPKRIRFSDSRISAQLTRRGNIPPVRERHRTCDIACLLSRL